MVHSSRSFADCLEIRQGRRRLPKAAITQEVMDAAVDPQEVLAARGQHRLAIPAWVISAAAKLPD